MEHTNPQEQAILKLTGEFVKHKRRALGYNTQGVARLVNLPQSAFSKIENGTYTGLKHVKLYAEYEVISYDQVSQSDGSVRFTYQLYE